MTDSSFKDWLEDQRDSAKQAYQDGGDNLPFGREYEQGMYHAYQKVLERYDESDYF